MAGRTGLTELNTVRERFSLGRRHLSKDQREVGGRAGTNDLEAFSACLRSTRRPVGPRVSLRR